MNNDRFALRAGDTSRGELVPIQIVEVGPRDGLQNEKALLSPEERPS